MAKTVFKAEMNNRPEDQAVKTHLEWFRQQHPEASAVIDALVEAARGFADRHAGEDASPQDLHFMFISGFAASLMDDIDAAGHTPLFVCVMNALLKNRLERGTGAGDLSSLRDYLAGTRAPVMVT